MMPKRLSRRYVRQRKLLYRLEVVILTRYSLNPPTFLSMDMWLSLRMISRSLGWTDVLFNPSKAKPPDMDPSPMMAATRRRLFSSLVAMDMPREAEMELEA